jgi:PBP1b-binding outer membrane lipoprotein LpoB
MNRLFIAIAASTLAVTSAPDALAAKAKNLAGRSAINIDINRGGPVNGLGIEVQDIVAMTDEMMRDMLSVPELAGRATPPQITVDSSNFSNDSLQRIDADVITNRLRIALNRAAAGRMTFVGRHFAKMVQEEHQLKENGIVDVGTLGAGNGAQAGADYRLGGSISTQQSRDSSGMAQRYTQITFEMVDMRRGIIVWSGMYEIGRAGADDVIYR